MARVMPDKIIGGKKYKYWKSVDTRGKARVEADKKRRQGYSVVVKEIHYRQFDLYIRKA